MTWGPSYGGRQQCSAQRLISLFSFVLLLFSFLLSPWYAFINFSLFFFLGLLFFSSLAKACYVLLLVFLNSGTATTSIYQVASFL